METIPLFNDPATAGDTGSGVESDCGFWYRDRVMRCVYCAEEIRDEAIKCRYCGSFLPSGEPYRRLTRSRRDRKLAGICGGMAAYLGIDPAIVRILWVLAAFVSVGTATILYVALIFILPNEDEQAPK